MSDSKPRLRFKRQASADHQEIRGYELWYGDTWVGSTGCLKGHWPIPGATGCYWYAPTNETLGIRLMNTASNPVEAMEIAKAQLRAYVEAALKAKKLR